MKQRNPMSTYKAPWWEHVLHAILTPTGLGVTAILIPLALMIWHDETHENVCVDSGVVKRITRVMYRDAEFELEDGRLIQRNQSFTKPGDTVCVRSERRKKL